MCSVIDEVEGFSAGTTQADDITCLAVRREVPGERGAVCSGRLAPSLVPQ